jgi:signal transduction histidine kinase/ligand-binding sensor domain-containing protein
LFPKIIYTTICTIIFIICTQNAVAQTYQPIHHFTNQTGLPSNLIYELQQDTLGNLWICTNNGISRWDGKYFRNYNFKDGLPSNDVVALRIDNYGRLWLNCFGHKPTYFENDAFHVIPTDTFNKIVNKNYTLRCTIENEVAYDLNKPYHSTIFAKDKTYHTTKFGFSKKMDTTFHGKELLFINDYPKKITYSLYKNTITDSVDFDEFNFVRGSFSDRNGIYAPAMSILKEITINVNHKFEQATYEASTSIVKPCFSAGYIILVDKAAMVFIYNRVTKKLIDKLQAPDGANCAWLDQYNQLWVGTKNDGLYCYAKSEITTYLNNRKNNQFLSIYASPQNEIFAGNGFGEVHQIKNNKHVQQNFAYSNRGGNIKAFLLQGKELYALEDNALLHLTTNKKIQIKNARAISQLKSGVSINDSILFVGMVSGPSFLNTKTKRYSEINKMKYIRVNACTINKQGEVYFTSANEIHKVHYPENGEIVLPIQFQENEIPISLTCTDDNMLWVATNESRVYIIQENKILHTLQQEISQLQALTHITSHGNQIVLSSKSGLAIITYTNNQKINCKMQFVNQQDGLPSNIINQSYITNDSIYVATENGIAVLQNKFISKGYNITPTIQSVKLDNTLMPIQKTYKIKAGSHTMQLQIGGVDISGHLYAMQYALNDTMHWATLEGNQLSLFLPDGETQLFIRTQDIQNQVGKPILACVFDVDIPFHKTVLFWMLLVSAALSLAFWRYNRKLRLKQKAELEKQLALDKQRQDITADLHDDIGATLSSLQLNSTIAKKTIGANPTRTTEILNTIESQSKELSEKIGDIIWSMKSEDQAFGTFSDRIKIFASQLLDNSTIDYSIHLDENLDQNITSSLLKKNLILVSKEALNNAVKYSLASKIEINCLINGSYIILKIKDNGKGFTPIETGGNGLKNMEYRVNELGGRFKINSEIENGTEIVIEIPTINRG